MILLEREDFKSKKLVPNCEFTFNSLIDFFSKRYDFHILAILVIVITWRIDIEGR